MLRLMAVIVLALGLMVSGACSETDELNGAPAEPTVPAQQPAAPPAQQPSAPPIAEPPATTTVPPAPTPVTPPSPAPGPGGSPTWASLGGVSPLWIDRGTNILGPGLAADPSNPRRIAYCAPGGIQLSTDGGATWTAIPTAGALEAASTSDHPLLATGGVAPACTALALDPAFPDSVYAVFQAGKAPFGAPPIVSVAYETAGAGQRWQEIPAPEGVTIEQFGGLRVSGGAVQAIFALPNAVPNGSGFVVEQTADGGQTWTASSLGCPDAGPCVRWGPAPNVTGSCAMHPYFQPVERSTDGGQTWQTATLSSPFPGPGGGNACGLNELAALSPTDVLLIAENPMDSAGAPPSGPLQLSRDGGQTWQVVSLPPLPGPALQIVRGLQMLPDGSLLTRPQEGDTWQVLAPGAADWCAVPPSVLDASFEAADSTQVIGDRLWWLENAATGAPPTNRQPEPKSVPLSGVGCGS